LSHHIADAPWSGGGGACLPHFAYLAALTGGAELPQALQIYVAIYMMMAATDGRSESS
jgi:hypothetical protein